MEEERDESEAAMICDKLWFLPTLIRAVKRKSEGLSEKVVILVTSTHICVDGGG
jgi:hypothetical protein